MGIVVARTTIVVVVVVAPFRVGDATGRPRGRDAPTLTSTIASPRTVNLIGFAGSMVACVGVPRSDRSMPPRVRRLFFSSSVEHARAAVAPDWSSSRRVLVLLLEIGSRARPPRHTTRRDDATTSLHTATARRATSCQDGSRPGEAREARDARRVGRVRAGIASRGRVVGPSRVRAG